MNDLRNVAADCLLIAGDIAMAGSVTGQLERMERTLGHPIYFVLGNHDYYYGSIADVRASIAKATSGNLRWLNQSRLAMLTAKTALVGHDGWCDSRLGDFHGSRVNLSDFLLIKELGGLRREDRLRAMQALGDESARHLKSILPEALARAEHVVVLTHVPPYAAAAWHQGKQSNPDWLPFFSCKACGDVLTEAMVDHPDKRMTVLCGHTHSGGVVQILQNLTVYTGAAQYGLPRIQSTFEWN